jgi:phage terminase large subunit
MSEKKLPRNMAATLRRWREDPVAFVRENFGVEPDPFQLDVLTAFPREQRIAMKACKGPGKTAVESWCAWNFLATRPHPKIAVTSITGDNLSDNFWPEMAKWQNKSPFLKQAFEWTKTRIFAKAHPETWWCSARSWSRNADPGQQADTLAGLHADYLMFILDESGGIPDSVMAAAEGGLSTGVETKILQGGNPTHLEGPLYRACTSERHLWYVVTITGDPDNPQRSPRISIKWAKEQIEKYGRDNPWVLVNVFGQFPPSSINSLLGPDDLEKAMGRKLEQHAYVFAAKVLGVDVARYGDDRTVVFPRQGLNATEHPIILRNADTHEIAGQVARKFDDGQFDHIFVDDTGGWGAGTIDALLRLGYPVTPVNSSSKAFNPRYMNKRAEMAFEGAEWVRKGGALPDMPELSREATAATYFFNAGRLQLIDKDMIKKLIGASPDLWDAFLLTFASPVASMSASDRLIAEAGGSAKQPMKSDYDPFDESRAN